MEVVRDRQRSAASEKEGEGEEEEGDEMDRQAEGTHCETPSIESIETIVDNKTEKQVDNNNVGVEGQNEGEVVKDTSSPDPETAVVKERSPAYLGFSDYTTLSHSLELPETAELDNTPGHTNGSLFWVSVDTPAVVNKPIATLTRQHRVGERYTSQVTLAERTGSKSGITKQKQRLGSQYRSHDVLTTREKSTAAAAAGSVVMRQRSGRSFGGREAEVPEVAVTQRRSWAGAGGGEERGMILRVSGCVTLLARFIFQKGVPSF